MPIDTASPCSNRSPYPASVLQGVGEGVAEIEQRALAAFALVFAHNARLVFAGARHRIAPRLTVAGQKRGAVPLQPDEEIRIVDQSVFDDLGITRLHFAFGARWSADRYRPEPNAADRNSPPNSCPSAYRWPSCPPTEESTWASKVVGIWMKGTPRSRIDAANPARSPITPPPSARMVVDRSQPACCSVSSSRSRCAKSLVPSPGDSTSVVWAIAAVSSEACRVFRWRTARFSSVTMKTRFCFSRGRRISPAWPEEVGCDMDVVAALAEIDANDGHGGRLRIGQRVENRPVRRRKRAKMRRLDRRSDRPADPSIDDHVGLRIDRIAFVHQCAQYLARIARIEDWAMACGRRCVSPTGPDRPATR